MSLTLLKIQSDFGSSKICATNSVRRSRVLSRYSHDVDADVSECGLDELADGMRFVGGDDEVLGLFVLQHQPHRLWGRVVTVSDQSAIWDCIRTCVTFGFHSERMGIEQGVFQDVTKEPENEKKEKFPLR